MVVRRWQVELVPTEQQIKMLFVTEGLEPFVEVYPPNAVIKMHRHPFDEVRMVVSGALLFNISGNQLLLRAGDHIAIPSNTKHETRTYGDQDCECVVAFRVFQAF